MTLAPTHLLVAVDADATSEPGLAQHLVDVACDWAGPLRARLTLCHVALPVVASPMPPMDSFGEAYRAMNDVLEARNAAAQRALQALQERAAGRGCAAEVSLMTRAGRIPELIVEAARAAGADALMVATHGRKGLRRLVLGSVAERVAHIADIPVLLVPPEHAPPGAAPTPA